MSRHRYGPLGSVLYFQRSSMTPAIQKLETEASGATAASSLIVPSSASQQRLGADFLALLEDPGPTSDLTLTAAGGRSFPVHRAILAARCEFFKAAFCSGVGDAASAPELPLPEADTDALALLLRYIYGGILDDCERDLLKPAVELADFLRLVDACEELRRRLLATVTKKALVEDLLWAEGRGYEDVVEALADVYAKEYASASADPVADALAERSPRLLTRLLRQVVAVRPYRTA